MIKRSPFRDFSTSPEIICQAVMLYARFPRSLRNFEVLVHARGVEISYEAVGFWWHRFGPIFASEARKRRIEGRQSFGGAPVRRSNPEMGRSPPKGVSSIFW